MLWTQPAPTEMAVTEEGVEVAEEEAVAAVVEVVADVEGEAAGDSATKIIGAFTRLKGARSPISSSPITSAASRFFMATRTCLRPMMAPTATMRRAAARHCL